MYRYYLCLNPKEDRKNIHAYLNRIQKFTGNGTFLKVVGSAGNEILQFNSPVGIRVNDSGEVYVCDRKNHRIQVLDCNLSFCAPLVVVVL